MPRRWTSQEVDILRNNYPRLSLGSQSGPVNKQSLLSLLPNKSWIAIRWKAAKLELVKSFKKVYDPILVNDFDRGYIAGLLDGEGCIRLSKVERKSGHENFYPYISISNTDLTVLEWIRDIVGFGRIRTLKPPPISERTKAWNQKPWKWRKCYTWRILSCADCYRFIKDLGGELKIKYEHGELLLDFLEIQDGKLKPEIIRDPDKGTFKRRVAIPLTDREREIYKRLRELNHR